MCVTKDTLVPAVTSPTFKTPLISRQKLQSPRSSQGHRVTSSRSSSQGQGGLMTSLIYDPPTDMDTDVSTLLQDADDSVLWGQDNEPVDEAELQEPCKKVVH